MAQMCPAKSTIVPFKKQMYGSGSIILSYKDDKCICVSIHAPTRGATKMVCRVDYRGCFNPRTHEGCDRDNRIGNHLAVVSIHAPTRGATKPSCAHHPIRCVSIHAPTRGATCTSNHHHPYQRSFNPRTHEGCDWTLYVQVFHLQCFNPRTHEGCDSRIQEHETSVKVSIHAPTRGATSICSVRV